MVKLYYVWSKVYSQYMITSMDAVYIRRSSRNSLKNARNWKQVEKKETNHPLALKFKLPATARYRITTS